MVQGSWKFWVLSESRQERDPPSEERGPSNGESSPLLQRNGYDTTLGSSSQVQFKQPSMEERGTDSKLYPSVHSGGLSRRTPVTEMRQAKFDF